MTIPWGDLALNGQPVRTQLVRDIIFECEIKRIIETGTMYGSTTAFFASFGLPVVTAEINAALIAKARERLEGHPNIDLLCIDSVTMMQALLTAPIDFNAPTLFYLDAHGYGDLPLREEIEIAINNFSKAVVMIDDFAVPDDPGYGFDNYGPGNRIDHDYLKTCNIWPLVTYLPSTPSNAEGGMRRGCAVVTSCIGLSVLLNGIPLLRRWST